MTDLTDWQSALNGNGEAFARVFDRHRDRVLRHSVRLVPARADADDVVAVVFMEAWRKRERVRFVDDSLLPWLLVVATNVSLNLARSSRRYQALLHRLPPPPAEPDPAEGFDAGDARTAFAQLSRPHREVVALCVLQGYSEAAAAEVLGIPCGTVKSRLSRAMADLRRRLATMDPPLSSERTMQ